MLAHFALFQIQRPQELGLVTTDIAILAVITITLLGTHRLTSVWRGPFAWLNVGIALFFIGFLFDLLADFFIQPTSLAYAAGNGAKLVAFGILAWGFVQWGKERIQAKQNLERLREVDALTGLPGRSAFHQTLERFEGIAKRYQESFSLIAIDIIGFKDYVPAEGAARGDELLKRMADFLRSRLRENDLVFRYEEHRFLALFPLGQVSRAQDITELIARRHSGSLKKEFASDKLEIKITSSFYEDGRNPMGDLETKRIKTEATGADKTLHLD